MKITQAILDNLTEQAKASPRLRMNLDLRNSADDQSQRMLNAIEPGSPLPIHRHRHTSETVVCLRGRLVWEYYQELRDEGSRFASDQSSSGEVRDSSKSSMLAPPTLDATRQSSCEHDSALAAPRVQKVQEIELSPNGQVVALNIPAGQWHTVRALESGSVILEMKDGKFEPLAEVDILQK